MAGKKEFLNHELGAGLSFASSMSGVSLFFTGIIISQYQSFDDSIRIPIVFLIISTFSFIFAAAIYSNAGSELTADKLTVVEKYLVYAKNIVEILGLYLFILATPLVLGAVTEDTFLKVATIAVATLGMFLFSQSKFSVLDKELPITAKRIVSTIIVALALLLYFAQARAQNNSDPFVYNAIAVNLVLLLGSMATLFSRSTRQHRRLSIRRFRESDAERLEEIIDKNIARAKARHLSPEAIKELKAKSSVRKIKTIGKRSNMFVATINGVVVGMAAIKDSEISNVFTDPSYQKKGIGRMLVETVEQHAEENGLEHCDVVASVATRKFYQKMSYELIKELPSKNDPRFLLRKQV